MSLSSPASPHAQSAAIASGSSTPPPRAALLLGGLASIATAVTTFFLWYLPRTYEVGAGFEGVIALHAEPAYMARLGINYAHVLLALFAYGVVAATMRGRAPIAAGIGFIAFLIWCIAEALIVSINIWAVNETWRAAYGGADELERQLIRASLHSFSGIWNGVFFVILTAFLIGTLSFAIALFRETLIQKALGVLFFLAAPLTLIIMLDGYFGAALSGWISWSYPILQPLSRAATGLWLVSLALQSARFQGQDTPPR